MYLPNRLKNSRYTDNFERGGVEDFSSALSDPSQSQSTPMNSAVSCRPIGDDKRPHITSLFYDYSGKEIIGGVPEACNALRQKLEEEPIIVYCTSPEYKGRTLLAWFAGNANGELLEVVVETIKKEAEKSGIQPSVDPKDESNMTPLLALAKYGASNTNADSIGIRSLTKALDCLLLNGANPNLTNEAGLGSLHLAIDNESLGYKSLVIVDRLLKAGVNPNSLTLKGESPLDFFLNNKVPYSFVGKLLIIAGAREVSACNCLLFKKFLSGALGLTPLTYQFLMKEIKAETCYNFIVSVDIESIDSIDNGVKQLKKQLLEVFDRMLIGENDELKDRPCGEKIIKKILRAATATERETIIPYLKKIPDVDPSVLKSITEKIPDNKVKLLKEFVETYKEFPEVRSDPILGEYWRLSIEALQEKMPKYILEEAKNHPTILTLSGCRLYLSRDDYNYDYNFFVRMLQREESTEQKSNSDTMRFFKKQATEVDSAPSMTFSQNL